MAQGLGPKYIKHASESLMAINILVYVRLKLQKHLSSTATSHVPTGAVMLIVAQLTYQEHVNRYCYNIKQLTQLEAPKHDGVVTLCYGNRVRGRVGKGLGSYALGATFEQWYACMMHRCLLLTMLHD